MADTILDPNLSTYDIQTRFYSLTSEQQVQFHITLVSISHHFQNLLKQETEKIDQYIVRFFKT